MIIRLLLVAVVLLGGSGVARADRLDLVQRRGVLIVGVKSDYVPFGSYDSQGRLVGIEPDLAADLAKRLGVGLELAVVTSANRLQKLEQGSVDVIIATLGDTPERRAIATLVEPAYFASGANVMLRPDAGAVRSWADLNGKPVCATQGALFNAAMASRYLMNLKIYNGTRDAKLALKDGRCVGWLYDDVAIANNIADPNWAGYRMPLPTAAATPWALALSRNEAGGRLERIVGDTVAEWHRSGHLIDVFRHWGMPASDYLQRMHRLWTATRADGRLLCTRQADGSWPTACREENRLTATDVGGLHRLALTLRERTGLDLSFLYNRFEQGQLVQGLLLTLLLVLACTLGSLALGLMGAALMTSRLKGVAAVTHAIAAVCRMTPPLLQLYLVFFGLGQWLVTTAGIQLDSVVVVIVCLSLYAGAANAVAIAEARQSLSVGRDHAVPWRMALAQAWTPVMSSSVNVAKATGMASAIAVPELVHASTGIVAENGNPGVMMNLLMLAYFAILLVVVQLFEHAGRRWLAR